MRLYHTTPTTNLKGIYERGIDPAFTRCARREVWLHSHNRMAWAESHVKVRHQTDAVTTIAVDVPRSWLTRRRRGLWTCDRVIHYRRFADEHKYIAAEVHESARVKRYLSGQDISQESPLWHAPHVPTYYNALLIAAQLGIQREQVTVSSNGRQHFAIVTCRCGNSTRAGASTSRDSRVAIELAFRNAVRQIIEN